MTENLFTIVRQRITDPAKTFIETAELPKAAQLRDEVLRWKLKRLVPFRVEDLPPP